VEGRKSIGGVGVRETGCGEVEVPATGDETGLDPFAGGAQLDDLIGVSPIAGHVSGNPPVRELLAPVDEEGEGILSPSEQVPEPFREGFAREVLFSVAGSVGEGVEGVVIDFSVIPGESTHGPFCIGRVVGGNLDIPSPGTMPEVGDDEGGEAPLIVDEVDGAFEVAEGNGGGGGLGSDSGNLGLEIGGEPVIDRCAVDEGMGEILGDLLEVAG
jgi:hypothetical protein